MLLKATCPSGEDDHITFTSLARVSQVWEVDSRGGFVKVIDHCEDVYEFPGTGTVWRCVKCGEEAEVTEHEERV